MGGGVVREVCPPPTLPRVWLLFCLFRRCERGFRVALSSFVLKSRTRGLDAKRRDPTLFQIPQINPKLFAVICSLFPYLRSRSRFQNTFVATFECCLSKCSPFLPQNIQLAVGL